MPDEYAPFNDALGRPIRDLRISVTDRCNFRCTYCMPKAVFGPDHPFLPRNALLTYEEIARIARAFVGLGVRKIRLTGGEPLLRRDLTYFARPGTLFASSLLNEMRDQKNLLTKTPNEHRKH